MPSLKAISLGLLLVTLPSLPLSAAAPHARNVILDKLPAPTPSLFDIAMQTMDSSWDSEAHLVRYPAGFSGHPGSPNPRHMVRETSNYALGLLMRDGKETANAPPKDLTLSSASSSLKGRSLVRHLPAYPRRARPAGAATVMWTNYDPNWRVFIGTTFELILIEYPERIPPSLALKMYKAIDAAIDGEMKQGRLKPNYSNIALMYGALWDFAANHDNNAEWKQKSSAWIREVSRLYHPITPSRSTTRPPTTAPISSASHSGAATVPPPRSCRRRKHRNPSLG